MKRSGFPKLTYEQALQKAETYRERQRARAAEKTRQTASLKQVKSNKPKTLKQERAERKEEARLKEKEFKDKVRRRDRNRCQYPGCIVVDKRREYSLIQVHHKAPRSRRKDLLYDPDNGVCLCNGRTDTDHHKWVHDHPIQAEAMGLLSFETRELAEKRKLTGALNLDDEAIERKPTALSFDDNGRPSKLDGIVFVVELDDDSPFYSVPATALVSQEVDISGPLDPEPMLVKILKVNDKPLSRELEITLCNNT